MPIREAAAMTPLDPGAARALRLAEAESERMAAVIRVAIFAALVAAVLVAQSAGFDHGPLVAATAVYGAGTAVALLLAWRRIFRPWLPYAFVLMDVATLGLALHLLGRMLALAPEVTVTLPVGGLVIVVLLHASMHYRPSLVAFGAVAFIVCLGTAATLMPVAVVPVAAVHDHATEHLAHFRLFPIAIFVLASAILILTTRRTRRFIGEAFAHASRAATLSRYFSPEVVEALTERPVDDVRLGERMRVAVLFADLRGFTAMAEAMDPAELAGFLSTFRARLAAPAIAHGGVVDKYIGDAIMVVFGAPQPRDDDAQRALRCAVDMAAAIDAWSSQRVADGGRPLSVAIGGHYGTAFAGVLSDGRLLEYTVIGDTVNVASRLADVPEPGATQVLVSAALVEAAGGLPDAGGWTHVPAQPLPGHPRALAAHRRTWIRTPAGSDVPASDFTS